MKKLAVFAAVLWVSTVAAASAMTITVDLSSQRMQVQSSEGSYTWRVSTARAGYVTPAGNYKPVFLTKMHYSTRYHNSPMPYSIFFTGNFAIHGTYYVGSLGRPASHGCVRLDTSNAKRLYEMVQQEGMQNVAIRIVP